MSSPVFVERSEHGDRDVFAALGPAAADGAPRSDRPLSTVTYVIAMLPRTGSTALCSLLERTECLGKPDEYLNPRGPLQHWARALDVRDPVGYLDLVRRERSTDNGVFGLKTTYHDFLPLLRSRTVARLLGDVRFVYLTRRDLLEQAISEYIAEQSGIWHRDADGRPYGSSKVKETEEVGYDETAILGIVDRLVAMQHSWERFFVLYGIEPLRISYEELCSDAGGCVARVAGFLGVPWVGSTSLTEAATSKLADGRTDAWAAMVRRRHTL